MITIGLHQIDSDHASDQRRRGRTRRLSTGRWS